MTPIISIKKCTAPVDPVTRIPYPIDQLVHWSVECSIQFGQCGSSGSEIVEAPAGATEAELKELIELRYATP